MKKISSVLFLLVVMMFLAVVASAQSGVPGSGWWSGEQIQNVGSDTATINIIAYDSQSSAEYSEAVTVTVGSAYTFTPIGDFDTMPAGFQGSAVVSSNQPVKAIVNVTNQLAGGGVVGVTGGKAAAQYQGTDGADVASTLYFPLAKGDHYGKTSSFYIQNAGSADAAGVTATFTMRNGDTHVYDVPTIGVNKMVVFSVNDAPTYNPSENDGRVGSLVVSGLSPLAGVVMEHDTTASVATVLNSTRGFTSADFDTKAYAPVVKNNRYGRFTGIQVQNVSGGSIDITVAYTGGGGCVGATILDDTATAVADGTAYTFIQGGTSNMPDNCTGSATISATGDFIAVVNEQEVAGAPKAGIVSSAISDGAATTKVSIPLFKDDRYGARTGLQVQNVGSSSATAWTATFSCGTFTAVSSVAKTGPIASGGAFLFYTPSNQDIFTDSNPFVSNGVNCAVTIESDQPIVAIANEGPTVSGSMDDNNYEGFNLTP